MNVARNQKPNETLTELQKEFDEFIYLASHDLKEPARKVCTFGERLQESLKDKLSETEKDFFKRMLSAARRQQDMVDDLLQLSRVKTTLFTKTKIDLADLFSSLALNDGTTLAVNLNAHVIGDKVQLKKVLQELVTNAEKFNENKPKIEVCTKSIFSTIIDSKGLNTSRNYIYFLISDNGIGIADENLGNIFKPFFKEHGHSQYTGGGLGLAISKTIIEKMEGSIWCEPTNESGSTFHILLPAD
jgi:signal transduction histidine kinase